MKMMHKYFNKYHDLENMFFTGHSLGAALVQTMALMLPRLPVREKKPTLFVGDTPISGYRHPHCYMFSSPTVGDGRFTNYFQRYSGEAAHVYFDGDVVTSVPPFLVPAADITQGGWNEAIQTLGALGKKSSGGAGLIWGLHQAFKHLNLPSFMDISNYTDDFNSFDREKLLNIAVEIARANNDHRALRGGGVFFRMDPHSTNFVESTYDPGNSTEMVTWLAKTVSLDTNYFKDLHSIDKLVTRLERFAINHPDVFSMDVENLPAWANGGAITPGDNPVPSNIQKLLQAEGAHVIGYAKTKHHWKPYQLVPKGDIDEFEAVWFPEKPLHQVQEAHSERVKRRRTDKADHSYNTQDYF